MRQKFIKIKRKMELLLLNNQDIQHFLAQVQMNMAFGGYFTLCYERMIMLLQKLPATEIQYVKS